MKIWRKYMVKPFSICAIVTSDKNRIPWLNRLKSPESVQLKREISDQLYLLIAQGVDRFVISLLDSNDLYIVRTLCKLQETHRKIEFECVTPYPEYLYDALGEGPASYNMRFLNKAWKLTAIYPERQQGDVYDQMTRYLVDQSQTVLAVWDWEPDDTPAWQVIKYACLQRRKLIPIFANRYFTIEPPVKKLDDPYRLAREKNFFDSWVKIAMAQKEPVRPYLEKNYQTYREVSATAYALELIIRKYSDPSKVAKAIKVPGRTVYQWLQAKPDNTPNPIHIQKICDFLNFPIEKFRAIVKRFIMDSFLAEVEAHCEGVSMRDLEKLLEIIGIVANVYH